MLGGANVFHTTGVGVKVGVEVAVLLASGVNCGEAADELFVEVLQPVSINKSPTKTRQHFADLEYGDGKVRRIFIDSMRIHGVRMTPLNSEL